MLGLTAKKTSLLDNFYLEIKDLLVTQFGEVQKFFGMRITLDMIIEQQEAI